MAVSSPAYGSDQSGLISGYVFSADGVGRAVDTQGAEDWLRGQSAAGLPAGGFMWLHFNAANAATARWIEGKLKLSEEFFEALREGTRSTRVEYAGASLVAILNDLVYDFSSKESSQAATLWLSVDSKLLVSVRHTPLRSIDRLRQAVKAGEAFFSPLSLVLHLLRDQGDVLLSIIRRTAVQVDGIEDELLSGRLRAQRVSLGTLRRDLVRLQRLLAPEPAALFRLLNRPPAWIAEHDATELRQSAEEFAVILRDMTSLQERIKLIQEEIAAMINERTGRTVFVLTAVTVLALPVNMIAGLFGMNVGGVPYNQDPEGFWLVVGIVLALSAVAGWLVFRDRGD